MRRACVPAWRPPLHPRVCVSRRGHTILARGRAVAGTQPRFNFRGSKGKPHLDARRPPERRRSCRGSACQRASPSDCRGQMLWGRAGRDAGSRRKPCSVLQKRQDPCQQQAQGRAGRAGAGARARHRMDEAPQMVVLGRAAAAQLRPVARQAPCGRWLCRNGKSPGQCGRVGG